MKIRFRKGGLVLALIAAATPLAAQVPSNSRYGSGARMPLAPIPERGEPVAPFFEGWYENEDGSFTLSFGYFNLNGNQALDVPLGPENRIEPADYHGVQPTHFPADPRRERGIFHVTVPASWDGTDQRVVWTITANGKTHTVPAKPGYSALQLDYGPRAMGSVPPTVRFSETGPRGQFIQGITSQPRTATVGQPLTLDLWVEEISVRAPDDVVNQEVETHVNWFKYTGPAQPVVFEPDSIEIAEGSGRARATATFGAPGAYVLRARVDNFGANDSQPGDQCCWTNAYVPVTVQPARAPERD